MTCNDFTMLLLLIQSTVSKINTAKPLTLRQSYKSLEKNKTTMPTEINFNFIRYAVNKQSSYLFV
jgi:hypothetical protein